MASASCFCSLASCWIRWFTRLCRGLGIFVASAEFGSGSEDGAFFWLEFRDRKDRILAAAGESVLFTNFIKGRTQSQSRKGSEGSKKGCYRKGSGGSTSLSAVWALASEMKIWRQAGRRVVAFLTSLPLYSQGPSTCYNLILPACRHGVKSLLSSYHLFLI